MTKKQVKAKCEKIARDYGAKLTWLKGKKGFGYYIPGTNKIFVADGGTLQSVISIFCHELGHYENHLTGRYYKYHHLTGRRFMRTFKKKNSLVRYALRAEIFTDKVGKKLCGEYFPNTVYRGSYKMNQAHFDMMYQKYFGGFIIILLENFKF